MESLLRLIKELMYFCMAHAHRCSCTFFHSSPSSGVFLSLLAWQYSSRLRCGSQSIAAILLVFLLRSSEQKERPTYLKTLSLDHVRSLRYRSRSILLFHFRAVTLLQLWHSTDFLSTLFVACHFPQEKRNCLSHYLFSSYCLSGLVASI